MNLKEVKEELNKAITQGIEQYGFSFIKKANQWEREIPGGTQIFYLLYYKHPNSILVDAMFKVKLFLIEDIYHRVTKKGEDAFDATLTIGASVVQIMQFYDEGLKIGLGKQASYLIETTADLDLLKKVFPKRFEEYVLPYFNSYSSIDKVDRLLNEYPREISIHNYLYPVRACIAIIAAKLNRNPEYSQLIRIYNEETKNANPHFRKEFEDLVNLLESSNFKW